MYNTNIDCQIEIYQGIPIEMKNNKSLSKYTLQDSLNNIKKAENKQYLNILITDIEYLELIGKCISFCRVGITGIDLQQKKIIAQFYANRVLIIDETIKNSYIDIVITNNRQLINKLSSKNYIKYIYSIYNKFSFQYFKTYQSAIPNSYFYMNRLSIDAYKQLVFKADINKDTKIDKPILKQIKKIDENKQIISQNYVYMNNIVNIIISYYNNQASTIKTLKSIQKYSQNTSYKINIILISDGSKQNITNNILKEISKFKSVTYQFIVNEKRIGYIKSINKGIKRALQLSSQYILLMHNDIEVSYNWQDLLLYINDTTVGACPITNSQYDQYQSIKYIRANNILQNFPKSFQKCKTLTINQMLSIYKNKQLDITENDFIPSFFCIAFNAKIFNQIGLLDESFGQGFGQNIDYIYRLFNNDYKISLIPSVYIPHIGRNTFKDLYSIKDLNKQITIRQHFNKFSLKLNRNKNKKKVIYTYITNNYDIISNTYYNTEEYDYILFGQQDHNIPQPWKFINIQTFKQFINTDDPIKIARFFKTHPHLFFKNYEMSLWIDENIDIISDPNNMCDLLLEDEFLLIPRHPQRTSVYAQAQVCKAIDKDSNNTDKIIQHLNNNGFKDNTDLVQSSIIIRRHNSLKCKKLMENWWNLILNYSHQDQLSFNFCLQKSNQYVMIIDWNIFNNKYIKQNGKRGNSK